MAASRADDGVTPERWQQIKAIVADAMETPFAERAAYVAHACAGDAELLDEVTSLLLAAGDGGDSFPAARAAIASTAEKSILESALGQQYEIVRQLGRGGMGAVYLARERALERFVAIKVLRPDLAEAPDARERFRREARIAAQLSHPGILPLHTFGEVAGLWYFVMAYVRGVSLAERLRVEGRLPVHEALRILTELTDALECAHRNGVIHRDIKPANILLDEESGRAMLADFGVAKVHGAGDSLTVTGMVIGTPDFMSPEQARGAPDVDERSDLYSLGAVGYTMLAGRAPFADVRADDMIQWRASHDPAALQSVAPAVSSELAAVVMRSLVRERSARWPTARSFRDALARASGDPATVLPESLRDLPTFGPYAVIWAVAWTSLAVRKFSSSTDRALLLLIALLIPVGFGLHIWNVGRSGLGGLELARVAFWPPEWWGMWWPRPLRRPNDLWPRLPMPARLLRRVMSVFFVLLPGMILVRQWFAGENGQAPGEQSGMFVAAELLLVFVAASVMAGSLMWGVRRGLSFAESVRVLFGATAPSPGWKEPHIARLLTSGRGGVRPPERDAPADHRRAIDELVATLPVSAAIVGTEAAAIARQLLAAIEACDAEMILLGRVANSSEIDRLTSQLATLGDSAHGEGSGRNELHDLVQRQLEVVRRMRDQSEVMSQRRARLFNMMRGLWTQLSAMHDGAPDDATALNRLRTLLDEATMEIDGGR
ncbi:MAG: serine/threonine-protein kinase [bacterium]